MQITSLTIDWYNCGLCCGDDLVHEKTTVYRTKNAIRITRYNGRGEELFADGVNVSPAEIESFFCFLESIENQGGWETDYSVFVCDGFGWDMRLRHGRGKITKVTGTIEYPPHGELMENMIIQMLEVARCLETPVLFGLTDA